MPTAIAKSTSIAKVAKPVREAPSEPSQQPRKKKKKKRYRSRKAQITIASFRLFGFGYAAILATLIGMETRLVYPGAYLGDNPARESGVDGKIETVSYESTDGLTLNGRLLVREQSDDFLLFFHGNASKAVWLDSWINRLSDAFDATVMVGEYRGYEDDMTPNEKGVLEDSFAARDYLCERFGKSPSDLILYGRSLGGGCAVAVASQGGAKALVLDRTFDRMVNVAANRYPFIPVNLVMRNRYDSVAKLTVFRGPLVVLHGTTDKLIPIHHGEKLFASAGCEPKCMITVEGLGHNDTLPAARLNEVAAKVKEFTTTVN